MLAVGARVPHEVFAAGVGALRDWLDLADDLGLDQVCVGDHVSFRDGTGYDGLLQAAVVAALSPRLAVHTAVYVLPLRHPVPVARQVASLAELAPGRFTFGVGIGGEDRSEMAACGVDPSTRGRRMDEALTILRSLLTGRDTTSYDGEFFAVSHVRIKPAPLPAVPIVVGGRSAAAVRRAALLGDGWSGVWTSPERYAGTTREIEAMALAAGRAVPQWRHSMLVWCGIGTSEQEARSYVAAAMEGLYGIAFERFERYCPYGTPEQIADALVPYVEVGCPSINLLPVGPNPRAALEASARVADLLRTAKEREIVNLDG